MMEWDRNYLRSKQFWQNKDLDRNKNNRYRIEIEEDSDRIIMKWIEIERRKKYFVKERNDIEEKILE